MDDLIYIPVSPGELLDKITILEIKAERIDDAGKLRHVRAELDLLTRVWNRSAANVDQVWMIAARKELKEVNEELWDIEDHIRLMEAQQKFDQEFVALARSVYTRNDRRAELKKHINGELGSEIVEEKSYAG